VTELTVAGLVAGEHAPGVYRWDPALPAQRVAAGLTAAGWAARLLSGDGLGGRSAFLAACGAALDFPEWYGQNWDALSDCLRDLSWLSGAGVAVLWVAPDVLAAADAQSFRTAVDVFAEAAYARDVLDRPPLYLLLLATV
jgi:hypothetical protein